MVARLGSSGGARLGFAALALFVVIGVVLSLPDEPGMIAAGALVALAGGLALYRLDDRFLLPGAVLASAGIALIGGATASNLGWFALCVLASWCMLAGGVRVGLAYWVLAMLLLGAEWLLGSHDPGWGAWMAGVTFAAAAAAVVHHEIDLVEQLRAAQAGLAERSAAAERNRIARDLHDVLAHSLTVSLLHLSSARLAVEHDPAEAAEALAEAERLSRRSLDEVRSVVGLMRPDVTSGSGATPVEGIDGVDRLIDDFRRAGVEVRLSREGQLDRLPATTGAIVYRIAQESLTNAAKHAPGFAVAVDLAVADGAVELTVDSAGPPGQGSGLGMQGMRERAHAVGGECSAGPRGDGWRVRATLPLDPAIRVEAS